MKRTVALEECWKLVGIWGDSTCSKLKQHMHCRACPVFADAALQLLDRDLPEDYSENWARHFARYENSRPDEDRVAFVFRVGPEWFALPASCVMEVGELKPAHPLPHRRSSVLLGLVNIRGELVVAVSIALALGVVKEVGSMQKGSAHGTPRIVVLETGSGRLATPVDEVAGVLRYRTSEVAQVPSTILRSAGHCLRGIIKSSEKVLRLLEPAELFQLLGSHLG